MEKEDHQLIAVASQILRRTTQDSAVPVWTLDFARKGTEILGKGCLHVF
jgi:hypothetical protein